MLNGDGTNVQSYCPLHVNHRIVSASKAGVASMLVVSVAVGSVCGVEAPATAPASCFCSAVSVVSGAAAAAAAISVVSVGPAVSVGAAAECPLAFGFWTGAAALFSNLGALGFIPVNLDLRSEGVLRGGLLTSVFSCTLFAELAVGRIMRARKLSSEPRGTERDSGFLVGTEGERAATVLETGLAPVVPLDEGLACLWVLGGGFVVVAGLAKEAVASCLAADADVGAVM